MFDQLVESSLSRHRTRRWKYFTATAIAWVATLAVVVVGGVVAYEGRLGEISDITHVGLPQPRSERGPDSNRPQPKKKAALKSESELEKWVSQPESPDTIETQPTATPVVSVATDSDDGPALGLGGPGDGKGKKDGVKDGDDRADNTERTERPEPPQPEKKREEQPSPQLQPVAKSGGVLQGSAIRRVSPTYPPLARVSRTTGTVVVEVVVDESGNVISARDLSGHPLLREAAVYAARQWKWRATLLSGVPVQVVGTITFNFTL
jgi:protein TonB